MIYLMTRLKGSYIMKIQYPETEDGMLVLRKSMGNVYINFVKNYIISLPISDEEKNKLYLEVINNLQKK